MWLAGYLRHCLGNETFESLWTEEDKIRCKADIGRASKAAAHDFVEVNLPSFEPLVQAASGVTTATEVADGTWTPALYTWWKLSSRDAVDRTTASNIGDAGMDYTSESNTVSLKSLGTEFQCWRDGGASSRRNHSGA